jgi:hypothetical protein
MIMSLSFVKKVNFYVKINQNKQCEVVKRVGSTWLLKRSNLFKKELFFLKNSAKHLQELFANSICGKGRNTGF